MMETANLYAVRGIPAYHGKPAAFHIHQNRFTRSGFFPYPNASVHDTDIAGNLLRFIPFILQLELNISCLQLIRRYPPQKLFSVFIKLMASGTDHQQIPGKSV